MLSALQIHYNSDGAMVMAILAECPLCHRKQAVKNRKCKGCQEDLVKPKKAMKVRYWIDYKVPNGKPIREPVGFSIEEARDAQGKRRAQKIEQPKILERLAERKITFQQLTDWWLDQPVAKAKKYLDSIKIYLNAFNKVFGHVIVANITTLDLENYQADMRRLNVSDAYIDHHIGTAKLVVKAGYAGKKVSADTLQGFREVKRLLKMGSNKRKRILSVDEYDKLIKHLPRHILGKLVMGYFTGMRKGEIDKLIWPKVDLERREIRLLATDTKDNEERTIPIGNFLYQILAALPRDSEYVFTYRGRPVKDMRNGLRKACEKAGIAYGRFKDRGFVFHDLRHSFVTMMRKAGVQQSVRMSITGHSTVEMDSRYDSVDTDDKIGAVAKHEELVSEFRSQRDTRV
jgi:integrase